MTRSARWRLKDHLKRDGTVPRSLAAGSPLALNLDRMAGNGVPLRALMATWVLVGILLIGGSRGELFALSSVAVLIQYVVAALSLLELGRRRERGLDLRKAWAAIPAMVVGLAIVTGGTSREWVVAAVALLVGLILRGTARSRR